MYFLLKRTSLNCSNTEEERPKTAKLINETHFVLQNWSIRGVSHCGLAINIEKYLKAKEELWKFKYFTMHKYNLQKNPLQETKIVQDIIPL
jgi:hypothetical protein